MPDLHLDLTLRPVAPAAAAPLLAACELPIDDLDSPALELVGAFGGDALLGVIGLERCGAGLGLLRSLAVAPAARARGIAGVLCGELIARARRAELRELFLLTTTAADYFTRHGFARSERAAAPAAIRAHAQFTSLCPASAVLMRRDLA